MEKHLGKVSVIIPAYNTARFVAYAVDSALSQTYKNIEVIIVDDGSTDDTRDVIEKYGKRVRYIHQMNAGPASARNAGLSLAGGEFIAFLDADDTWMPEKTSIQMDALLHNPTAGLVYSEVSFMDEGGIPVAQRKYAHRYDGDAFSRLIIYNFIPSISVLVRKECFDRCGSFRSDLLSSEDWDMWLRIARRYPIMYLEKVLAVHRVHGRNITKDIPRYERAMLKVVRDIFADPSVPAHYLKLRRRAFSSVHRQLAGLSLNENYYQKCIYHLIKSFWYHPIQPMRRFLV